MTRKYTTSEDEYISQILHVPVAKAVKNACVIFDLVDLKDLDPEQISSYLKNVKQHYLGRFSPELDDIYAALEKYFIAQTTYSYIRAYDDGPLYRVNELKDSWIYNASTKQWESCDPDFLIDNEHDAYLLTEDEAIEWINDKT